MKGIKLMEGQTTDRPIAVDKRRVNDDGKPRKIAEPQKLSRKRGKRRHVSKNTVTSNRMKPSRYTASQLDSMQGVAHSTREQRKPKGKGWLRRAWDYCTTYKGVI